MRASRERCHHRCPPVATAQRLPCPKPTQLVGLSSEICFRPCIFARFPCKVCATLGLPEQVSSEELALKIQSRCHFWTPALGGLLYKSCTMQQASENISAGACSGMEDTFWTGPEPQSVMPRRRSFPALGISALWRALPSSGQQPAQKPPYPPLPLSRALWHPQSSDAHQNTLTVGPLLTWSCPGFSHAVASSLIYSEVPVLAKQLA